VNDDSVDTDKKAGHRWPEFACSMRTILEIYQQHADDCASLAEATDDPKRRETFLKMAAQWTQAIHRGSMTKRTDSTQQRAYSVPERRRAG
jgi:hypothetical protein